MITCKRKSSIVCFGHPDEPSESNLGNFETVTQQQYNAGSRIPLRTTAVKQATSLSDPIMEILWAPLREFLDNVWENKFQIL